MIGNRKEKNPYALSKLSLFDRICISLFVLFLAFMLSKNHKKIERTHSELQEIKEMIDIKTLKKMKGPIYLDPDQNMILIKLSENGIKLSVDPNFIKAEER